MLNVSTQRVRLKPNLQAHGGGPADMTFLQFRLVEVQCSVVRLMQGPHTDQLTNSHKESLYFSALCKTSLGRDNSSMQEFPSLSASSLKRKKVPRPSLQKDFWHFCRYQQVA